MLERFLPKIEFDSYESFKADYKVNVPQNFNFAYDVMDEWAKISPEKPALYYCDETPSHDKILTFADIKRESDKTANALKSLGVGKGDAVMVMLMQRTQCWTTMLAIQKIGGIIVPVTYQLTPKDISYRCEAAKIKVIVAVNLEELTNHIKEALPSCSTVSHVCLVGGNEETNFIDFESLIEYSASEIDRKEHPNVNTDPMLIYFSSGTTGMPKMVLHNFEHPLGHIVTAKYWHEVEEGGLHLVAADSGWAKFGWGKIYGQWLCGAVIVAYDTLKFNAHNMLETLQRLKVTSFCAPPTVFRFLIKEDISNYDLSSVKHCCVAGEPLNPEVFNEFKRLTGLTLTEGFGQSETSVLIGNFKWFPVKPGSTGKPVPLYDIDIVDENGDSCEDGIVGRIVVKNIDKVHPVGLFCEYYNAPDANARAFKDGCYDTGDTAWRDGDGYYWFVGRSDDVIKCSGYRIGPFEVENALMMHPSVLECAVTAAPDEVRGQVVKATIVLSPGYTASDELKKEIQNHVKRVTAPYKYPRIVEFRDSLPKTVSGKIRRVELR